MPSLRWRLNLDWGFSACELIWVHYDNILCSNSQKSARGFIFRLQVVVHRLAIELSGLSRAIVRFVTI